MFGVGPIVELLRQIVMLQMETNALLRELHPKLTGRPAMAARVGEDRPRRKYTGSDVHVARPQTALEQALHEAAEADKRASNPVAVPLTSEEINWRMS